MRGKQYMAKRGRKKKSELTAELETPAVVENAAPKKPGRQSQYSDAEKAAFLDAVKNGRKADASWNEIFDAAKAQGFKGGLPYLKQMAMKNGVLQTGKKRMGRPKGSKNKVKLAKATTKSAPAAGASLGAIEGIVEKMVAEKLAKKMSQAVAILEKVSSELRAL